MIPAYMLNISYYVPFVIISALRKKLRAVLGYDPIRNRIGEGYEIGGEVQ